MADTPAKTEASAEKAYATAASDLEPVMAEAAPVAIESSPAEVKAPSAKAAAPVAKKPAAKKAVAKRAVVKKAVAKKTAPKKATAKPKQALARKVQAAPKAKPARKPTAKKTTSKPTIIELKDKIMATKTKDFTETMTKSLTDSVGEFKNRAQAAYDKSTEAMAEVTDFAKGNVEALVETSKIVAGGVQDLGKTYVDEAKSAYETLSADMKDMAAVKSPTELFQLQGKILRRNFDAFVSTASKNSEAVMKLANDAVEPITGRMNVAAEKLSKVA